MTGSNTIGSKLIPVLLQNYVRPEWTVGKQPNEKILTIGKGRLPKKMEVKAHGSNTAFTALQQGTADIGMSSRPITIQEQQGLQTQTDLNIKDMEYILALDGLVIIVHPDNPVKSLTIAQIAQIFSGKIQNWSVVGGEYVPINLYARDDQSGTFNTFQHFILNPLNLALYNDAKRFESNNELVKQVASDPYGIGFTGYAYIHDTRALGIEDCHFQYFPNRFSIKTEEYPFTRRLYLYTNIPKVSSYTHDFIDYVLSDEGQRTVRYTGFVDLAIEANQNRDSIERYVSHFAHQQYKNSLKDFTNLTQDASRLSVTFRFEHQTTTLDNRAHQDIKRLVTYLKHPRTQTKTIMLFGFTDGKGSYQLNRQLSQQRAEKVAFLLEQQGFSVLTMKGYGETIPVACDNTRLAKQVNHRVEVWVK
ncbi:phosphate ABC transporter substrate-binding/OmpA family protein [Candidatus Albibeggiatoa sp. nov. NOAA]|uniref:phosphate ABC transporter substrate-binding/OmpA family protein n=1 Tax=Candidatus Albibeggiatoa sp. nov. NOAA TaxID=3162724 RepID=UPI0032F74534|nr:phosphate ABC transporter substrate-binding/OmpA family protein [Thiotrichaceae bacterium]